MPAHPHSLPLRSQGNTFHIPKGDVLMASPTFAHRLPQYFKNPDYFDPSRFLAPRCEDRQQFAWMGFGYGRHRCMGEHFAYLQVSAACACAPICSPLCACPDSAGVSTPRSLLGPKPICAAQAVKALLLTLCGHTCTPAGSCTVHGSFQ